MQFNNPTSTRTMKKKLISFIAFIAFPLLSLSFCESVLAAGFGNDTNPCAADRPCFNEARQVGNKIFFKFTGVNGGWDFYNLRYAHGGGEKQIENRSGSFTFNNVKPNQVYTLKVQGCNSHTFSRSTCSPWSEQSVTTH
jgi:hypothetical protein